MNRSRSTALGAMLVAVFLFASCDLVAVEKDLLDGFLLELDLSSNVITQDEEVEVRMAVTNLQAFQTVWSSPMACLSFLRIERLGETVPMEGSVYACLAVGRTWEMEPGETVELVASVHPQVYTQDGLEAVPPGTYRVLADFFGARELDAELQVIDF